MLRMPSWWKREYTLVVAGTLIVLAAIVVLDLSC